jgi:hypothetical protein
MSLTYEERRQARLAHAAAELAKMQAALAQAPELRWVTCPQCGRRCEICYGQRGVRYWLFHPGSRVECRLAREHFRAASCEEVAEMHRSFAAGYERRPGQYVRYIEHEGRRVELRDFERSDDLPISGPAPAPAPEEADPSPFRDGEEGGMAGRPEHGLDPLLLAIEQEKDARLKEAKRQQKLAGKGGK